MSDFNVAITRVLSVVDHPHADTLSINKIFDYDCITNKTEDGSHILLPGDLVAYIPEDAIVPNYILKTIGFTDQDKAVGIATGPGLSDRVVCQCLRNVYTQGLVLPVIDGVVVRKDGKKLPVKEGDDVAEFLGITKRVIKLPEQMLGTRYACNATPRYDFNNLQRYPRTFADGEEVEVSEKLHGTLCMVGSTFGRSWPDAFGPNYNIFITSKGQAGDGIAFRNTAENTSDNLYVRTITGFPDLLDRLTERETIDHGRDLTVFGEIYGSTVQDLDYGLAEPRYRVFDIAKNQAFLDPDAMRLEAEALGLDTVPVLYRGPFSKEKMIELRDGPADSGDHLREGIVIRSITGRRRIMKFVSPQYLTREGPATEFQ